MSRAKQRYRETYKGVSIDLTAPDLKTLNEKVRKRKDEIDEGTILRTDNVRVSRWCDEWLEAYKKPTLIKKSYTTYQSIVNKRIKPAIGSIPLRDVTNLMLQKIISEAAGMSYSHAKHILNTIQQLFRTAKDNGFISTDISISLELPKTVKGKRRSMTPAEISTYLKALEHCQYGLYGKILYYFGLRPQEAAALLWSDVDTENKILHVTKAVESGKKTVKTTKTSAGIRDLPIPDAFFAELKTLSSTHEANEVVLKTATGTPADENSMTRWWKAILREMNIEMGAKVYRNQIVNPQVSDDLTAYCVRHTYCTNLQSAGVPLNIAKYLMGHDDVKMTANIYTDHTSDHTEAARKMMNAYNVATQTGTNTGTKRATAG